MENFQPPLQPARADDGIDRRDRRWLQRRRRGRLHQRWVILGNGTLEFLPAAEAACTETLQISGDGLGTPAPPACLLLLLLGPTRIRNMRRLCCTERRWMCCFFYCITAETCSIINRGHLWQREELLACPSGASEGADEVVEEIISPLTARNTNVSLRQKPCRPFLRAWISAAQLWNPASASCERQRFCYLTRFVLAETAGIATRSRAAARCLSRTLK